MKKGELTTWKCDRWKQLDLYSCAVKFKTDVTNKTTNKQKRDKKAKHC